MAWASGSAFGGAHEGGGAFVFAAGIFGSDGAKWNLVEECSAYIEGEGVNITVVISRLSLVSRQQVSPRLFVALGGTFNSPNLTIVWPNLPFDLDLFGVFGATALGGGVS